MAFARWISPDFAVWADQHIDALLRGDNLAVIRSGNPAAYRHQYALVLVVVEKLKPNGVCFYAGP
ncbi:KilA-N domain-containing protein [Pseudomonas sp.]|uniref:KilA-N domain-containing protein n=1 Tax=Pseudomonas sp. TaxID=306 RepID=UPI003D09771C